MSGVQRSYANIRKYIEVLENLPGGLIKLNISYNVVTAKTIVEKVFKSITEVKMTYAGC